MPKKSFTINEFHNGVNNIDSARDLEDGFLAEATNVDLSEEGKVICLGTFADLSSDTALASNSMTGFPPGYGLFKFTSDIVPTGGGTGGEYLVYTDGAGVVKMNTATTMAQFDSADLGSDSDSKPIYYYADGGLRVADSDHTNTNTKQLCIVRIARTTAPYSGVSDQYKNYSGGFAAPADGDIDALSSPTDPASGAEDGTDPSDDIKVEIVSSSSKSDGLWPSAEYNIGMTYVYFNNQESKVSDILGNITLADAQYPIVSVSVADGELSSDFIQGMRLYLKDINNPEDEFRLLLDIDFNRMGSRKNLSDPFDDMVDKTTHFVTSDTSHASASASSARAYAVKSPALDTYGNINGYDPGEDVITFNGSTSYSYSTAEVVNQRTFVGNVKYVDDNGNTKVMGDRIQYTPVRKYDIFPQSYYLDLEADDGDKIIKLATYGPYLFVFKKNKLTLINIESGSDAGWYVEETYEGRGISNPGAVAKAPQGLMWANENGLFSWQMHKEGRSFTEETYEDIGEMSANIKNSTWQTNINADYVQCGYIPKDDKIIIVGNSNADDSVGYMFDIKKKCLVNINSSNVMIDKKISNFAILNEELVVMKEVDSNDAKVQRWVPTPVAQTIDIKTKEFTLDKPSTDKRFYSVFATYNNGGSSAAIKAGLDGASPSDIFIASGTENVMNASSMGTEEFTILTANRGGKSIQFQVDGSAHANFELQDLTFITRAKGER